MINLKLNDTLEKKEKKESNREKHNALIIYLFCIVFRFFMILFSYVLACRRLK